MEVIKKILSQEQRNEVSESWAKQYNIAFHRYLIVGDAIQENDEIRHNNFSSGISSFVSVSLKWIGQKITEDIAMKTYRRRIKSCDND